MSRAVILMYHRVTPVGPAPWGLRVTPEHFAEQVQVLERRARPLPMRKLIPAMASRALPPNSVVVTFDDGYADNLENARPVLERFEVPATFFLVTAPLGDGHPFWWDEVERVFLQPGTLPPRLSLRLGGVVHEWSLEDARHYSTEDAVLYSSWRVGSHAPTARQAVYYSVWDLLRPLAAVSRRVAVEQLVEWAGAGLAGRDDYRLLSPSNALVLADSPMAEIGAHSVTHPMLNTLPAAQQRAEIEDSRASLEELLGKPVTSFAYPHGAHSEETASLMRQAGYRCACSTVPAAVESATNPYRLPRFQVEDWDGDEFERRLRQWFGAEP